MLNYQLIVINPHNQNDVIQVRNLMNRYWEGLFLYYNLFAFDYDCICWLKDEEMFCRN